MKQAKEQLQQEGKNMILSEEQVVKNRQNNKVSLYETIWTNDGLTWYLIPVETQTWPNKNPHRVLYENLLGNRLVIWLNEVGGMIYSRVFA